MTIQLTVLKTTSGWPLTSAGDFVQAPWNDSPLHPIAAEQAPSIGVSRFDASTVELTWSPDSGQPVRAEAWVQLQLRGTSPVHHFLVDWGDGTSSEVVPGLGIPNLTKSLHHLFLASSTIITVDAYDANNNLVDIGFTPLSIVLSSEYNVSQYRIERFKGKVNYNAHGERWVPDWRTYTGSYYDKNIKDYEASSGWNWGYRLWLREEDDQGRPGLIMIPSEWAQTGTGEGS